MMARIQPTVISEIELSICYSEFIALIINNIIITLDGRLDWIIALLLPSHCDLLDCTVRLFTLDFVINWN